MSNDITLRPAYLNASVPPEGAFGEHAGQPARISMDDGFHVLDENGQAVIPPSLTLNVIMLWENDTRVYRPRNLDGSSIYDSDSPTPPTCWSDNKITPSIGAMQPQSVLCANCPHSEWNQPAKGGGNRPACDNRYKVACLVSDAGGGLFLLSVPPASRKPYEQYLRFLKVNHAGPGDVITTLGYASKILSFSFSGWITEATAKFVSKVLLTDEAPMIVGAFDKPKRTGALPKPRNLEEVTAQTLTAKPNVSFTVTKPTAVEQQSDSMVRHIRTLDLPSTPLTETPFTPAFGPVVTASVPIPEPKRRGRPPKPVDLDQQQASKGNGGFGMEAPTAPPANIQEALNRAFGPK